MWGSRKNCFEESGKVPHGKIFHGKDDEIRIYYFEMIDRHLYKAIS